MKTMFQGVAAATLMFAAAAAGAATVTVNIPDVGIFASYGTGTASVTYDGVVFSQSGALSDGNFYNVSPGFSGNPPVLSSQQQSIGFPNILITLPGNTTSATVQYGTFDGGNVTFLLSNGDSSALGSAAVGFTYALFGTYNSGVTSPFSTILITANDSGLNIGTLTYTTVPEPATWALMIGGFGLVGYAARRKRTLAEA